MRRTPRLVYSPGDDPPAARCRLDDGARQHDALRGAAPGGSHGQESGYLLDGEFTLLIEGQPQLQLKAGDPYKVPAGAIHDARSGDRGAKVIATYVVEKGKLLATPAP